jgi:hypothetical protein
MSLVSWLASLFHKERKSIPADITARDLGPLAPRANAQKPGPSKSEFTIEYVDSHGHESMRRVTFHHAVVSADDHILLYCVCHACNAYRTFRLDRIKDIIDDHGEVHDPQVYLRDALHQLL